MSASQLHEVAFGSLFRNADWHELGQGHDNLSKRWRLSELSESIERIARLTRHNWGDDEQIETDDVRMWLGFQRSHDLYISLHSSNSGGGSGLLRSMDKLDGDLRR